MNWHNDCFLKRMLFNRSSASDEPYFETVAAEVASGQIRAGLWTQCMADCNFDEGRAKSRYVNKRVKELREATALVAVVETRQNAQAVVDETRSKLNELNRQQQALEPASIRRALVFTIGIGCGGLLGVWLAPSAGLCGVAMGFVCAWLVLIFMPSQRKADKEASRIRTERQTAEKRYSEASKIVHRLST